MKSTTIVRSAAFCLWVEVPGHDDPEFRELCADSQAEAHFDEDRKVWHITTVSGVPEVVEPGMGVFRNELGILRIMTTSQIGEFLLGTFNAETPRRSYKIFEEEFEETLERELNRYWAERNEGGEQGNMMGYSIEVAAAAISQLSAMITAFYATENFDDPFAVTDQERRKCFEVAMQVLTIALLNVKTIGQATIATEEERVH